MTKEPKYKNLRAKLDARAVSLVMNPEYAALRGKLREICRALQAADLTHLTVLEVSEFYTYLKEPLSSGLIPAAFGCENFFSVFHRFYLDSSDSLNLYVIEKDQQAKKYNGAMLSEIGRAFFAVDDESAKRYIKTRQNIEDVWLMKAHNLYNEHAAKRLLFYRHREKFLRSVVRVKESGDYYHFTGSSDLMFL
jgi:hypothetical protein